jgi:hypothetical protein
MSTSETGAMGLEKAGLCTNDQVVNGSATGRRKSPALVAA